MKNKIHFLTFCLLLCSTESYSNNHWLADEYGMDGLIWFKTIEFVTLFSFIALTLYFFLSKKTLYFLNNIVGITLIVVWSIRMVFNSWI